MALWLCPVSVCWEVMLNFLKISEKSRLFDWFWHVDSAGSSRIYRCTMNHTTSRMITEVAMAMTSHIAAIVGKGVSLRGFTMSQDHCHDSKLSLSNHIKPYQTISNHINPSNAFKRVQTRSRSMDLGGQGSGILLSQEFWIWSTSTTGKWSQIWFPWTQPLLPGLMTGCKFNQTGNLTRLAKESWFPIKTRLYAWVFLVTYLRSPH